MDDDQDNVVHLPGAAASPARLEVVQGGERACRHTSGAVLNVEDRSVTCRQCNAVVDPFDALLALANDPSSWGIEKKRNQDAARRSRGARNEIERLERNAKGRAWRALAKTPDAEVLIAAYIASHRKEYGPAAQLLYKRAKGALEALAAEAPTGAAKSDKRRVLELLRDHPEGLAGFEVDLILAGGRGHFHKRLSQLGADNTAHRGGERKNPNGGKGDVWFAGPAPDPTVEQLVEQMHAALKEACALDARSADLRLKAERLDQEIKTLAPQRVLFR